MPWEILAYYRALKHLLDAKKGVCVNNYKGRTFFDLNILLIYKMPNKEKEALPDDIDWGLMRKANSDNFAYMGIDEFPKAVGDINTYDAEKALESWEVDCPIESGKTALQELIRQRGISYTKPDLGVSDIDKAREVEGDKRKKLCEFQDELLRKAYHALHPASPMKRMYNDLQFYMMWSDFDPCVIAQIVSDPKTSRTCPAHLLVMGQGVYQEFISSKGFEAGNLRVFEKYKEMTPSKPRVFKTPETVPYAKLPKKFKEFLINKTEEDIDAEKLKEDKIKEKLER